MKSSTPRFNEASRIQEMLSDLNAFLCCAGSSVSPIDRKGRSLDRIGWGRGRGVGDKRSSGLVIDHMICPKGAGNFERESRCCMCCV